MAEWAPALNAASGCWWVAIWDWWASDSGTRRRRRWAVRCASVTWRLTRCPWLSSCLHPECPRPTGTSVGCLRRRRRRHWCRHSRRRRRLHYRPVTRLPAASGRQWPPQPLTRGVESCVWTLSLTQHYCSVGSGFALCIWSRFPATIPAVYIDGVRLKLG